MRVPSYTLPWSNVLHTYYYNLLLRARSGRFAAVHVCCQAVWHASPITILRSTHILAGTSALHTETNLPYLVSASTFLSS
jgi:hypothetical protein